MRDRVNQDRKRGTKYRDVKRVTLDGKALPKGEIPLADDNKEHEVYVQMGWRIQGQALPEFQGFFMTTILKAYYFYG